MLSLIFTLFLCLVPAFEASKRLSVNTKQASKFKSKLSSSSSSPSSFSAVPSSSSSSSPHSKRRHETEAGDEFPLLREVSAAIESSIPVDRFLDGSETRRLCDKYSFSSSVTGQESTIPFLTMELDVNPKDVAKLLESGTDDLSEWPLLSILPRIYLQKRAFLPFCVFLRRYGYPVEFEDPAKSTPIACLTAILFKEASIDDLLVYFRVILETQLEAVHSYEAYYLDLILKAGIKGIPFLEVYFQHAATPQTSSLLALFLLNSNYKNIWSSEYFNQVLRISQFDPNARINCDNCPFGKTYKSKDFFKSPDEEYCLLTGLVLDSTIPVDLFECTYNCERVNTKAHSGTVFFRTILPEYPLMRFDGRPFLFLAMMVFNWPVVFSLCKRLTIVDGLESFAYFSWYLLWRTYFLTFGVLFVRMMNWLEGDEGNLTS